MWQHLFDRMPRQVFLQDFRRRQNPFGRHSHPDWVLSWEVTFKLATKSRFLSADFLEIKLVLAMWQQCRLQSWGWGANSGSITPSLSSLFGAELCSLEIPEKDIPFRCIPGAGAWLCVGRRYRNNYNYVTKLSGIWQHSDGAAMECLALLLSCSYSPKLDQTRYP